MIINKRKTNKICKGPCGADTECAIYFSSGNARLNAMSRDALGDPDYVMVEYENNKMIVTPSTDESDYKINKARTGQRFFSANGFMRVAGDIPKGTKIYGVFENNKLMFPIN